MVNKLYLIFCGVTLVFLAGGVSHIALAVSFNTWLTVQDVDLRVKKGSALDLEPLFRNNTRNDWNEPYLCAPLVFTQPNGFVPSKRELDRIVIELKSRGYNLVRLHFIDNALMKDAKVDFGFNKEQADRLFYFLALLKQNSIDYMIDAATSWNGAYGDVGKNRFSKKHNLRISVHFNQQAQAHWKKMVALMLGSVNPYTGRKILLEPSLVAITTFNEAGLRFNIAKEKKIPVEVKYNFQRWLKLQGKQVDMPKVGVVSEASKLMNMFLMETERKTLDWMAQYLRGLGYKGRITSYNNGKTLQAMGVRQDLETVSIHAYHDHPTQFVRKGSKIENNSSIASELPYIRYMSFIREVGKPLIIDEYDQPYWNQWRREAGITMASFASFQGWQAICRYANPIVLKYALNVPKRKRVIYPFGVGVDPVARAGEVLAALLFRRKDVTPASGMLGVLFKDSDFTSEVAFNRTLPDSLTRLALLTPVGIMYNQTEGYTVDAVIPFLLPSERSPWLSRWKRWNYNLKEVESANLLFDKNLAGLNTELASLTGELFLNASEKKFKVITSKTEAIVYDQLTSPEQLNRLEILQASGESVLSASSLDSGSLNTAKRVLVIFATDARNSFSQTSKDGRTLLQLGRLPIQIKSQRVRFSLENKNASSMRFYALNLRGERVEKLAITKKGNKLFANIDLSKLKNGPTTFFELALD